MVNAIKATFFVEYFYMFICFAPFMVASNEVVGSNLVSDCDLQIDAQVTLNPLSCIIETNTSPKYLCINGFNSTSIWAIWSDVELIATAEKEHTVKFIKGQSCEEVKEKYHNLSSSWLPSMTSWFLYNSDAGSRTSVTVLPYGKHCFAVSSGANFSLEVTKHKLRLLYPVLMVAGILLFFKADEISRNVFFYYSSGVSIGMILSILLLVFVVSRLIPKRSIGYAFLLCGSSLVAYILQLTKHHITSNPFEGNWIICSYFIISGLVSFLYCYYRGPVTSERGFDIMKWCLQGFSLFLVYFSIRCEKIALTFVLLLIVSRWISLEQTIMLVVTSKWLPYRVQSYFWKPKYVSMEEYDRIGREETARALSELRMYCESPDCNTWKIVSRLKSPKRFASFIAGGGHITEEEQRKYDEISFEDLPFMTSDEESDAELASSQLDISSQTAEAT